MSGIIGKNSDRSSGVIGTSAAGIASLAADSSPQLGGFLDAAGNYIQMEKGGDISSASPTVIDTDGDYFDVTGTTNFAAFTVAADRHFFIQFDGALTMTHHATNLDLPGGANITTAAGDVGEFFSTGANTVQCVNYTKADGTAVVSSASGFEEGSRATMSGDQSGIATATATKIVFDTEAYDLGADYDPSTNYRFVAPTTGEYLVIGTLSWSAGVDQTRYQTMIYKNGSTIANYGILASGTGQLSTFASIIVQLSATDYIEIFGRQDSGSNKSVYASSQSSFSVHRLS